MASAAGLHALLPSLPSVPPPAPSPSLTNSAARTSLAGVRLQPGRPAPLPQGEAWMHAGHDGSRSGKPAYLPRTLSGPPFSASAPTPVRPLAPSSPFVLALQRYHICQVSRCPPVQVQRLFGAAVACMHARSGVAVSQKKPPSWNLASPSLVCPACHFHLLTAGPHDG